MPINKLSILFELEYIFGSVYQESCYGNHLNIVEHLMLNFTLTRGISYLNKIS